MAEKLQIPAEEFLAKPGRALLDVRAEVEFEDGHIPSSVNIPILDTQARHLVGIRYKENGQNEAIKLGHDLVDPLRTALVEKWVGFLQKQPEPFLTCFRGGMRSEYSQRWIEEAGHRVLRITGGYKALRRILLRQFEKPLRAFVITGLTGSAKTQFLRQLNTPNALDLEAMAVHRGSAFGGLFQPTAQPAQQTFENRLAVALHQRGPGHLLLEDESRLVGKCVIPAPFFKEMQAQPRIFLVCTDEERVNHILQEYVLDPLKTREKTQVQSEIVLALRTLRNRLGGLAADEIDAHLRRAFNGADEELHREWIRRLLHEYYDRLYSHAMSRYEHEPVFKGTAPECVEWLKKNSAVFSEP